MKYQRKIHLNTRTHRISIPLELLKGISAGANDIIDLERKGKKIIITKADTNKVVENEKETA
jgi:bifunctional DNA-binding transcriptional regulator/antitoxin component of YhaV-PrlF toxin-antitoxin module